MKPRYDLIVFDWDGTLMDSAAKIVRCFIAAATDLGIRPPGEAAIRNIIGLGLREAMAELLPDADDLTRARVVDRYRDHWLHLDQTEMLMFPGVIEGLETLTRRGYLLAVATGKSRRGLDRAMKDSGMERLFAATRCADEAPSKPHPKMLQDILVHIGVRSDRAIMVGDTVYDLLMARAASVHSLAVTYGAHDRSRLLEHEPLACFDSFPDVCRWLQ